LIKSVLRKNNSSYTV